MTDAEKLKVVLQVANALVDTVREAGSQGAPSGHLYAACMSMMSFDTYSQLMALLVRSGKLRLSNNCYFAT